MGLRRVSAANENARTKAGPGVGIGVARDVRGVFLEETKPVSTVPMFWAEVIMVVRVVDWLLITRFRRCGSAGRKL